MRSRHAVSQATPADEKVYRVYYQLKQGSMIPAQIGHGNARVVRVRRDAEAMGALPWRGSRNPSNARATSRR